MRLRLFEDLLWCEIAREARVVVIVRAGKKYFKRVSLEVIIAEFEKVVYYFFLQGPV